VSTYALQKLLREVNRWPERRAAFFAGQEQFVSGFDLTDEERRAVLDFDVGKLYALGVHGLILRPFTLLHKMPEPEYLARIRGAG
jgi:hypothetical protein